MGLPPVVIGLFLYLMFSQSGPFGALALLFTPAAMIVAQALIASPVVSGFTMAAILGVNPGIRQQVLSLGATPWQATLTLIQEARTGVIVAIIGGFGSIISEVGAVMIVGGNIEGFTRVLTTAIVLETRRGSFDLAIALGVILLAIAFVINMAMMGLQGRDLRWHHGAQRLRQKHALALAELPRTPFLGHHLFRQPSGEH
jgi:tungstate transport system permease protein